MGADLYNRRLFKSGEYTNPLSYFRDCYNQSGTFAAMGLSWWKHVGAILDQNSYDESQRGYHPDVTRKILELVKVHPHPDPKDQYYKDLVAFLQNAVDNNDYVAYSI